MNANNTSRNRKPKLRKWRKIIWFSLAIILSVPFILNRVFNFQQLSINIQELLLVIVPSLLLAVVLIVAYLFWKKTEKDEFASEGERLSQVIIFAIMVTSFYAFGWPDDLLNLKYNFAELSVIMVLFLLSELAAHQIREARSISQKIKDSGDSLMLSVRQTSDNIQKSLEESSQQTLDSYRDSQKSIEIAQTRIGDASQAILSANLKEVANRLEKINGISEAVGIIDDPIGREKLINCISDYTLCWANHFNIIEKDKSKLKCWQTICTSYFKEELFDLAWDDKKREIDINKHIMLATNERLYFELLHALATSIEKENGYEPVYRAITNMLPSNWYNNDQRDKGFSYAVSHIDKFRNTVEDFSRKKYVYERAILISDSPTEEAGDRTIAKANDLMTQKTYCILSLSTKSQQEPSIGPHSIKDWYELFCYLNFNEEDFSDLFDKKFTTYGGIKLYGILHEIKAKQIIDEKNTVRTLEKVGNRITPWKVSWDYLVDHYITTMHSEINSAKIIEVPHNKDPFIKLPKNNPDWLMVGNRKGDSDIKWIMALTASLKPGSDTMLVNVITKDDELQMLDNFWISNSPILLHEYLNK